MLKRFLKFNIVFWLIMSWVFAGYPLLWENFNTSPSLPMVQAVTIQTFYTSTSWLAPAGVTKVTAEVWGGGGGGGGYSKKIDIAVTPDLSYTVTVGTGGTGSLGCTASTAGGDSWFSTNLTVLAKGGQPGACSTGTPPPGGAGGDAASGVGDVDTKFSGGQGEIGRDNPNGRGGYGGSSAGPASKGWSGPQTWSTAIYPTADTPTGGGHGGDGGDVNGAPGNPPVPVAEQYGGGGGGAAEGTNIKGGNGAGGQVILTYNKPPNAPTQNSPVNATTSVSVTPTFKMTATDADTTVVDNLSYKVTIYSDELCTSVVQTNDQAVSSSGWTGTDASCTNAPTSCYLSGTQSSFLTQTSLDYDTKYWWRASAKDPDGNGTFTDSSTCNTFTTESQVISVSVSDGTVNYGTLQLGNSSSTLAGSGNDTQTVTNNGSVTETFNIKGYDTACPWLLAGSAGSGQYRHEASTNTGAYWLSLTAGYQVLAAGIAVSSSVAIDLRITVPTETACGNQQSTEVTIQAVP